MEVDDRAPKIRLKSLVPSDVGKSTHQPREGVLDKILGKMSISREEIGKGDQGSRGPGVQVLDRLGPRGARVQCSLDHHYHRRLTWPECIGRNWNLSTSLSSDR